MQFTTKDESGANSEVQFEFHDDDDYPYKDFDLYYPPGVCDDDEFMIWLCTNVSIEIDIPFDSDVNTMDHIEASDQNNLCNIEPIPNFIILLKYEGITLMEANGVIKCTFNFGVILGMVDLSTLELIRGDWEVKQTLERDFHRNRGKIMVISSFPSCNCNFPSCPMNDRLFELTWLKLGNLKDLNNIRRII